MSNLNSLRRELELPVSVNEKGETVTLYEFVEDKDPSSMSLSELSAEQWVKIVAERLRQQPELKLAAIGVGEINKEKAIAEVEALSAIGKALIESEQYVIETLVKETKYGRLKDLVGKAHA